ncbi:MAG: MFS transporter [Coriobacteriia bacterium]|nr:MFS transporter [Coriobacteriia bacterium]MBN2823007.1 MFS transporter [Coriobacteriia bacterium]
MSRTLTAQSIRLTYYSANGLFTLATSIIWGVNTLFLMSAGLDIFEVMIVNSAFTVGQLVFEVPTGVIADTVGRKVSFMMASVTLALSTLLYVGAEQYGWGIGWFIVASLMIGLGFTFQTGAVDAWLVDSLDHVGYTEPMDGVFAKGGVVFGVAMLAGTLSGGFLGQIDLAYPYYVRAVVLIACLFYSAAVMHDAGFAARPLIWRRFGVEAKAILRASVRYGWRNPVIRPLLAASLAQGTFFIFGFYSWQRYFLDLLAQELVWVAGVVTAMFSVAGIIGNAVVGKIRRGERGVNAGRLLLLVAAAQAVLAIATGLVGLLWPVDAMGVAPFIIAVTLYLLFGVGMGMAAPVRQAFVNRQIPSAQRATVLSVDSLFADVGASGGQLGLGWVSRSISIPFAWVLGGAMLAGAVPMYSLARRADDRQRARGQASD